MSAALDMDLIYQTLVDLRDGKTVQIPVYDFITHTRYGGLQHPPLHSSHMYRRFMGLSFG